MIDKALTDYLLEHVYSLCYGCQCAHCISWRYRLGQNGNALWALLDEMGEANLDVDGGFEQYERIWR